MPRKQSERVPVTIDKSLIDKLELVKDVEALRGQFGTEYIQALKIEELLDFAVASLLEGIAQAQNELDPTNQP